MSSQEFLDLIEPEIAKTVRETRRVFQNVNLSPDDVDYLQFAADVEQIERVLAHPGRETAAVMLLMLYCLRPDYTGPDVDRQKVELLTRLSDRFAADAEVAVARHAHHAGGAEKGQAPAASRFSFSNTSGS